MSIHVLQFSFDNVLHSVFCYKPASVTENGGTVQREELPVESNLPVDGPEWVELLVREMASASSVDDAKARVSRALEALEKSICANATKEAAQNFQKVCIFSQILGQVTVESSIWCSPC